MTYATLINVLEKKGDADTTRERKQSGVYEEGTGECTRNYSLIISIPFFMRSDALIFN
jgi:hypothetical protein